MDSRVAFIKVIKKHIDPGLSASDFNFWQNMSQVMDFNRIKANQNGYTICYYLILNAVIDGDFIDIESFLTLIDKKEAFILKFKQWLSRRKPKAYDFFSEFTVEKEKIINEVSEKYTQYKISKGEYSDEIKNKIKFLTLASEKIVGTRSMQNVLKNTLDLELNSPEIRVLFEENATRENDIYMLYEKMINNMATDIISTKNILLNSCMLTILGYYNKLKQRIDNGDDIPYYEMRDAYKILKTELSEPTKITESIQKNLDVAIQFPIDPESIKKYMEGKSKNTDLSINIAKPFRKLIEKKDADRNAENGVSA